jgi:hypothetical protein
MACQCAAFLIEVFAEIGNRDPSMRAPLSSLSLPLHRDPDAGKAKLKRNCRSPKERSDVSYDVIVTCLEALLAKPSRDR